MTVGATEIVGTVTLFELFGEDVEDVV